MCTPFSRLPQAQLLRLDSFFSGAMCVMSGGRLPEALFLVFLLDSKGAWFSDWIPKVQTRINLVDLVKSFQTSIWYLLAKIGVDTAENGSLKVCQKLANR